MSHRSDDLSTADEALLLRRIWDKPDVWFTRNEEGQPRLSSVAFLDGRTDEVSVNVAADTTEKQVLNGYPDFGLVSIEAGIPRSVDHIVALTPEVNDPSHRVICPQPNSTKGQRKTAARVMAKYAKWLYYPASHRNPDGNTLNEVPKL